MRKIKFPKPVWPAPLVLALVLSGGCAFFAGQPETPLSMFTDIPLPSELKIDEKNSRVYEYGVGRVGLMKLSGRIDAEAVINYFRETMPQNGWIKDSEFDQADQRLLVFSKSPRSAAVTVEPGWIYTDVEINVSAKQ